MAPDPAFARYLDKATFINKDGKVCQFTEFQKSDISIVVSILWGFIHRKKHRKIEVQLVTA
jgi:hypothetical protein